MAMTFEQFQATRTWCDDIGTKLQDASFEMGAGGWIYVGHLYIDEVQDTWPNQARDHGRWHLLINRDEWITNDLEVLELRLYAFAQAEGYEVELP